LTGRWETPILLTSVQAIFEHKSWFLIAGTSDSAPSSYILINASLNVSDGGVLVFVNILLDFSYLSIFLIFLTKSL
jgi:hypothetical protein